MVSQALEDLYCIYITALSTPALSALIRAPYTILCNEDLCLNATAITLTHTVDEVNIVGGNTSPPSSIMTPDVY